MKKNLKTQISFIVLWIFLIVSFSSLAIFVIFETNGYRVNYQTWKFVPSGLISLNGQPNLVTVSVNGKMVTSSLPYKLSKALPSQYEINVSKDNYSSWSKLVTVSAGQAYQNENIDLFLASPQIADSQSNVQLADLQKQALSESAQIQIIGNEIWFQEKLITRFSSQPSGVILTDDKAHIIFQLGSDLRVIDLDGSNNTKILSFSNSDPKVFALYSDKVVFSDQNKIQEAKIH